jgi:hypothetical protein
MGKSRFNIFIAIVIALFAWCAPKAEGYMCRGVYVNGQVHSFTLGANGNGQSITHQAFTADDSTFALSPAGAAVTENNLGSCTPDFGGMSMNGAVFGTQIFFAYTGNPGCTSGSAAVTHVYVIAWDLTANDFAKTNGVYNGPRDLGAVTGKDSASKPLGLANAAIVVFNNQLYVFADNATYTSADGVNWTSCAALPVGGNNMEPLDAIAYYPPDANPQIMIVYGNFQGQAGYVSLYAASWNGKFGTSSVLNGESIPLAVPGLPGTFSQALALLAGTESPVFPPPSNVPGPNGFSAGHKEPCLQLFLAAGTLVRRVEYSYSTSGGQWTVDPGSFYPNWGGRIIVFPWFTQDCTTNSGVLTQHLVIFTGAVYYLTSDSMVPQNTGIPPTCTNAGGTATNTGEGVSAAQIATFQKYWTLAGVVMGSPPFALNNATDVAIAGLSNVTYGQNQTAETTNTQETDNNLLVSAGLTVQCGLEHIFGIEDQFDASYKHGWESVHGTSTSSTVSYGLTMGTQNASTNPSEAGSIGMYGWAIFHVPTLVVQDYALYAYDYDTAANTGTYLDQDIATTQVEGDLSYRQVDFELANPGGPNDTIPGLMAGIAPLTKSTDLTGWQQGWESNSKDSAETCYTTLLGDGTAGETEINTITFVNGANGNVSYSQDTQTVTTTGTSQDVDVSNETSLSVGTEVNGFKVGVTAGYDGHFANSETTTTTLGSDVGASLGMINCSEPDCISSLTVQPYWLNAVASATGANAPWVPTAYNSQLPWALHWKIVNCQKVGGGQAGVSPPPDQGSGKVVGGLGGAGEGLEGASGGDSYSVMGGKMVWQKPHKTLEPIPMTAQEFDPSLGATVNLNGFTWSSSSANGTWTRKGNAWIFNTNKSVNSDIVVLKLDFGRQVWAFNLSRSDLSPYFSASGMRTHLALSVNGKYKFYSDYDHKVKSQWDLKTSATASDELSLSSYNGSFDSSTNTGAVVLEGNLPVDMKYFGDMSFSVNGHQCDVPLISHKNYAQALAEGGNLVYQKGKVKLSVDFGNKTWTAGFNGKIDPPFAPIGGAAAIQVKVGGVPWYTGQQTILNYALTLNYTNPGLGGAGPRSF